MKKGGCVSTLLSVQELVKDFDGLRAVDGVSFQLEKGEVLGFLGPNGAGKSTSMKMITGYLVPTKGKVEVAGFDVKKHPIAAKMRMGYLPEGAPAWGDMTPLEFLRFVADARALPHEARAEALGRVIDHTHIGSVLHKPIETLSKGFRRRVGLAQALIHNPDVLVLDEPTDGLDPNQKHEMRQLIRALAEDKAIIISTHILEEVEAVCSRSIIIDRGKVVADDTPMGIKAMSRYQGAISFQCPQNAELEKLLGQMQGIASFELDVRPAHVRVCLFPEKGINHNAIEQQLDKAGISYSGLHLEAGRLDEVFRRLTHNDAQELDEAEGDARD